MIYIKTSNKPFVQRPYKRQNRMQISTLDGIRRFAESFI